MEYVTLGRSRAQGQRRRARLRRVQPAGARDRQERGGRDRHHPGGARSRGQSVDTAAAYGTEAVLGKALKRVPRDRS